MHLLRVAMCGEDVKFFFSVTTVSIPQSRLGLHHSTIAYGTKGIFSIYSHFLYPSVKRACKSLQGVALAWLREE